MLFIDTAHERSCRGKDFVDKDEDGFFGRQLDALADHVDKLSYREICRYEILLLVDGRDI